MSTPQLDAGVLDFLRRLSSLDVPILTAPPGGHEFTRPAGWQAAGAADNLARVQAFRPGHALFGVMGGRVAVVDVDTKNGADVDRTRQTLEAVGIIVYADVLTPSGGRHFYVAGHPDVPTVHAAEGRDGLTGLPGVEIISYGANVFLPGTTRPKYAGAPYIINTDNLDALLDGGDPDGAEALAAFVSERRASKSATIAAGPAWDGTPPDKRQAAYLEAALRRQCDDLAGMGRDSGRNVALYTAALKLGSLVAGAGLDEGQVVDRLTEAGRRCGLLDDDGPCSVAASIASGLRNGRANPRAVPSAADVQVSSTRHLNTETGEDPSRARALLGEMLTGLRQWQHLPDPTHVVASLAVAATRHADGEPCWLLMVAPPSSGKTEAVRVLDDAADARLDEVTAAGLLGWSKGKDVRPTGVLTRVSSHALVTFGDLSSLLATSDRGGRDQVFGLLRRAYDGHVTRDVSPPGRTTTTDRLEWSGRLTVVACVTQAIDRYSAHADALGPRWVYVRLPERGTVEKRHAAALARRGDLKEHRTRARAAASRVLAAAGQLVEYLPDDVADHIEDAALVTAWGRASVPRNGYGRREIEGMPVIEEPMRLVQQLSTIGRGLLALGLPGEAVSAITRRVALDSMPENRRAVLRALSLGEPLNTSKVAKVAALDRKVARMTLEDLAAIGVVSNDRVDDDAEEPTGTVTWFLEGDDGALIAAVMRSHAKGGGWDEKWVYTSTSPQREGETDPLAKSTPTLRPTPDDRCPSCGGLLEDVRALAGLDCLACHGRAAS